MRASEIRSLGGLAGRAIAGPARAVKDVHGAVAGRVFGALGLLGAPVRIMHDGISAAAYGSVQAGMRMLPLGGAVAAARALPPGGEPMSSTPGGSVALGALNGAYGDLLVRTHRNLALELTVRRRGRDIETDSAGLARAFPDATPRLAVFVHGLCETDESWHRVPFTAGAARPSYGSRLRDDLGYTPIYVRYNSGLHVSDNGSRLAEVLNHVVRGWPVGVEEIALVGHSMGGLVARSACHYGDARGADWTRRVRHVFCLGSPHLGAPLEQLANVAGSALRRLPETRPFAAMINARSAGIKDLRFGSCVEEDWCDCDPDEFMRDRCCEVPVLPSATYYFVGATLAREPRGPFAATVGDLLVLYPSASGRGRRRRIPFELDNGLHVGRANHFQLLNHPAVYEQIRTWVERGGGARKLTTCAG